MNDCVLKQRQHVRYANFAAVLLSLPLGSYAFATSPAKIYIPKILGTFGRTSFGDITTSATSPYAGTLILTNDKLIVEDSNDHATTLAALKNEIAFNSLPHAPLLYPSPLPPALQFLVIDNAIDSGTLSLFSTHPPAGVPTEVINVSEFNIISSQLLQPVLDWTPGNSGDGIVNISGLNILAANWQAGLGQTLSVITPEPGSLTLLAVSSLLLMRRRKS